MQVPIFLSWVVSPVMSAIICTILFLSIRTFILRTNNSFMKAFYTLPLFVGGMFWLIVAFIIQTGAKNGTWTDRSGALPLPTCFLVYATMSSNRVWFPIRYIRPFPHTTFATYLLLEKAYH